MSTSIQAIRGFRDILPDQTPYWQRLEAAVRTVLEAYGYAEIRLPLLESTELFERSIGEVTDIVEKEMYTFEDRNGASVTLRPEGTAGCARAAIEHGLLYNQIQRLWYAGPMFRHERPQKGRFRQFHQIGVEAFGMDGPDIDAELILMGTRIWRTLGLSDVRLLLNSLGSPAARHAYRERLVAYFTAHESRLDDDSRRRLKTNPLRILDSKTPEVQALVRDAPRLADYLDAESRDHFDAVRNLLDEAGVSYEVEPTLVRGLDYYTRTVFEWVTDRLGAQGTLCAGGRYDGLVAQLGGRSTPAAGFAMGLERLVALLEQSGTLQPERRPHVYVVTVGEAPRRAGLTLAERLRDEVPGLRVETHCGGGGMKAQMRRADRSGAAAALILGDAELEAGTVTLKHLRGAGGQESVAVGSLPERLQPLAGTCGQASAAAP